MTAHSRQRGFGHVSRRDFLGASAVFGAGLGLERLLPSYAQGSISQNSPGSLQPRMVDGVAVYDLTIANTPLRIAGRRASAMTINQTVPGPLLHLYEGQNALLRVTNTLKEDTSIHWHGLILPPEMDGVPSVSFPGIRPGETFEYRFPLRQYGTYWYHSHSGLQEQLGHYGPLIIHPAGGYPYKFDREYVIVLADWTFENPYRVLDRLKKQGNYFNYQRRTLVDFFKDVARDGFGTTVRERMMWLQMRMDPTDILDVTGATYTYLMNGLAPGANWTGLFQPGERVLFHVVNAAAGTYFDLRIPDLPMKVVQASGQYVQEVETDEIRIAIAETYDFIVEPQDRPYTIFAESMDRSGYARGTLTPREGWNAPVPARRSRPVLTHADMGMGHGDMAGMNMPGMDMPGMNMPGMQMPASDTTGKTRPTGMPTAAAASEHAGHDMAAMAGATAPNAVDQAKYAIAGIRRRSGLRAPGTLPGMLDHEPDRHGPGNSAVPMMVSSRLQEAGSGLGSDGWRALRYTDLRSLEARQNFRAPEREIEIHLTGNMERFMWSINGKPFTHHSEPIRMNFGERVRLTMVNDTMMNHPMHLHGMFMELENGQGEYIPNVHTVNVKPAERLSLLVTADAPGRWAFHCHILYHMEVGMFRVFEVSEPGKPFAPEVLDRGL